MRNYHNQPFHYKKTTPYLTYWLATIHSVPYQYCINNNKVLYKLPSSPKTLYVYPEVHILYTISVPPLKHTVTGVQVYNQYTTTGFPNLCRVHTRTVPRVCLQLPACIPVSSSLCKLMLKMWSINDLVYTNSNHLTSTNNLYSTIWNLKVTVLWQSKVNLWQILTVKIYKVWQI